MEGLHSEDSVPKNVLEDETEANREHKDESLLRSEFKKNIVKENH